MNFEKNMKETIRKLAQEMGLMEQSSGLERQKNGLARKHQAKKKL